MISISEDNEMTIRYDMHLHSSFSTDSDASAEEMAFHAQRLGLDGICFTEHMDLDYPKGYFPEDPDAFCADPDQVLNKVLHLRKTVRARKAFLPGTSEKGALFPLWIGFGLEFGMQPHLSDRFHQIARNYPLDFIVASQHLVSSLDPYYPEVWEHKNPEDLIEEYYREMLANLKTIEDWDTLAHMDYIIRYIPGRKEQVYDSISNHAQIIDEILCHVIERGKCLEVNTAGYKYGLGQPNPAPSILRRYRELGGENITIGSDAHAPEHIAVSFDQTAGLLTDIGFTHYCLFERRKMYPLRFHSV